MRGRFLFRTIALKLSGFGIRLTHLNRFAVEADPARQTIFLVPNRFLSCWIALAAFGFALSRVALENSSIEATPARFRNAASFARFFQRIETLTASGFAIFLSDLDQIFPFASLEAAPTQFTMRGSVLFRRIASKISGLGIRLSHLHRFAVQADPARDTIFLVLDRFLFGSEILSALSLTFFLSARKDFSV
jgi:hypothetical protein